MYSQFMMHGQKNIKLFCYIFDNWVSTLDWISRWTRYGNSPTVNALGICQYCKLAYIILSLCYSFCKHKSSWHIHVCFILLFHLVQRVRIFITKVSLSVWHCLYLRLYFTVEDQQATSISNCPVCEILL